MSGGLLINVQQRRKWSFPDGRSRGAAKHRQLRANSALKEGRIRKDRFVIRRDDVACGDDRR